jgi:hypothetical protein
MGKEQAENGMTLSQEPKVPRAEPRGLEDHFQEIGMGLRVVRNK